MARTIEKEAIEYVKIWEKSQGRRVWKPKKGVGCDLRSSGGHFIEVKGCHGRPSAPHIYENIFKYLRKKSYGDKVYFIYIVYDLDNDPKLLRITPRMQEWNPIKIRVLKSTSLKKAEPISLSRFKKKIKRIVGLAR